MLAIPDQVQRSSGSVPKLALASGLQLGIQPEGHERPLPRHASDAAASTFAAIKTILKIAISTGPLIHRIVTIGNQILIRIPELKKLTILLASLLLTAACGGSSNTQSQSTKEIRNEKQAFRALNANDVTSNLEFGTPGSTKQSSFTTGFMNMTSTSQKIEQPMRFTATLGNSPAARFIKNARLPVYVYAQTQMELKRLNNKTGKTSSYTRGVRIEKAHCDGYKFVLSPENNYSIQFQGSQSIEIRSKGSSSLGAGILSVSSSKDWEIRDGRGTASTKAVRSKPFMVIESGGRYKGVPGWAPIHVAPYGKSKSCTYSAHKPYFKGKSAGDVRTAPKI